MQATDGCSSFSFCTRSSFHITASQVIEQHVELSSDQLTTTCTDSWLGFDLFQAKQGHCGRALRPCNLRE